jgi:hypothetical protein
MNRENEWKGTLLGQMKAAPSQAWEQQHDRMFRRQLSSQKEHTARRTNSEYGFHDLHANRPQ